MFFELAKYGLFSTQGYVNKRAYTHEVVLYHKPNYTYKKFCLVEGVIQEPQGVLEFDTLPSHIAQHPYEYVKLALAEPKFQEWLAAIKQCETTLLTEQDPDKAERILMDSGLDYPDPTGFIKGRLFAEDRYYRNSRTNEFTLTFLAANPIYDPTDPQRLKTAEEICQFKPEEKPEQLAGRFDIRQLELALAVLLNGENVYIDFYH